MLTFMFPKFIQVDLYLGEGSYIRDFNWASYLGVGRIVGGAYYGGILTGFYGMINKLKKRSRSWKFYNT